MEPRFDTAFNGYVFTVQGSVWGDADASVSHTFLIEKPQAEVAAKVIGITAENSRSLSPDAKSGKDALDALEQQVNIAKGTQKAKLQEQYNAKKKEYEEKVSQEYMGNSNFYSAELAALCQQFVKKIEGYGTQSQKALPHSLSELDVKTYIEVIANATGVIAKSFTKG